MAQIVLIAEGTYKEGRNFIDDVVAVHDDDVELSGSGYANFTILSIKGFKSHEVNLVLSNISSQKLKDKKSVIRVVGNLIEGKWVEYKMSTIWQGADNRWRLMIKGAKYKYNLSALTSKDRTDLGGEVLGVAEKSLILNKVIINQERIPEDQEIIEL